YRSQLSLSSPRKKGRKTVILTLRYGLTTLKPWLVPVPEKVTTQDAPSCSAPEETVALQATLFPGSAVLGLQPWGVSATDAVEPGFAHETVKLPRFTDWVPRFLTVKTRFVPSV
ncbi:MAG: hypothetical protein ACP5KA_07025, partial [Desulfurococcaceae archaeon]